MPGTYGPQERQLCAHAVSLGESGRPEAVPELLPLLAHPSAQVRRLAVSALGKLADMADATQVVPAIPQRLADPHPQVRQYAIKALIAYGAAAEPAIPDLHDIADAPAETDYNRRDAARALEAIRQAVAIAREQAQIRCRQCGTALAADEYARSMRAFQRPYCDKCFNEVYLRRRNYDTQIELNKTIPTSDGRLVQSDGERIIAEFLSAHDIAYRYDERLQIVDGYAIRPDFYLPEFDLYIEYWGMDTLDYQIGMLKKRKLYQAQGKRLVSISFQDKPRLRQVLTEKLSKYMHLPGRREA